MLLFFLAKWSPNMTRTRHISDMTRMRHSFWYKCPNKGGQMEVSRTTFWLGCKNGCILNLFFSGHVSQVDFTMTWRICVIFFLRPSKQASFWWVVFKPFWCFLGGQLRPPKYIGNYKENLPPRGHPQKGNNSPPNNSPPPWRKKIFVQIIPPPPILQGTVTKNHDFHMGNIGNGTFSDMKSAF